jgi:hypothetical protein
VQRLCKRNGNPTLQPYACKGWGLEKKAVDSNEKPKTLKESFGLLKRFERFLAEKGKCGK